MSILSVFVEKQTKENAKEIVSLMKKARDYAKNFKSTAESISSITGSLKGIVAKLGIAGIVKKSLSSVIEYQRAFYKINTLMGEGAKAAQKYAESLERLTGINTAQWLDYQSTFYLSASGMGIASQKAQAMSKNLTQLSYDMAAFNGEQQNAQKYASKLNEAYTGSIKALRNMGFALGEADLREEALLEGIDVNIRTLNAASKSMLRYNAIMRQSKSIQNSYVKASITLAGAQGIFNAQLKTLYQTLGGLIYPLAMKVLPYLIGMVDLLAAVIRDIAKFFNIEMPVIDTSQSVNNLGAIEEEAEDVGKAIKESFSLGIDELNVFNKAAAGGAGIGGRDITGLLDVSEYDFLQGYEGSELQKTMNKIKQGVDGLVEPFEKILKTVGLIGLGIAAWKISNSILSAVTGFEELTGKEKVLTKFDNFKIATGITLMITGVALDFAGAFAMGKGDSSWQDVVKAALGAALTLGGSLLAFGLTPVGWAVGIGLAVTATITGLVIGAQANINETIEEAFFGDKENAIEISTLTEQFSDLMNEIEKTNEKIVLAGDELEKLREHSKDTATDIESIATAIESGYTSASINIPQLESLFAELSNSTKQETDLIYDSIILAVSGSLKKTLEDMGEDVPAIIAYLNELKETTDMTYEEIIKEYDKLQKAHENGTISMEEYTEGILNLSKKLKEVKGDTDLVEVAFRDVQKAWEHGIDFKSQEDVEKFLDTLKTKSKEAYENTNTMKSTLEDMLDTLSRIGKDKVDSETMATLMEAVTTLNEAQKEEIKNRLDTYSTLVQDELIKSMDTQLEKSKEEYSKLDFWGKVSASFFEGKGEEGYSKHSLDTYIKKYVEPLESELKTAYEGIESTGSTYATETSKAIVGKLFTLHTDVSASGVTGYYTYASDINTEIEKAFAEIKQTEVPKAEEIGQDVVGGIENGIYNNSHTLAETLSSLGLNMLDTMKSEDVLDINSPSKAFEEIGLFTVEGLAKGITDNTSMVENALVEMFNTMLTRTEKFVDKMRTALNDTIKNFANSMKSVKIEDGEVSFNKMPKITIDRFDGGGYPTTGELFFARENGRPELVGQIGNRTAVMNNEQIYEGVVGAVMYAMQKGGSSQPIELTSVLELDGETIYKNQKKVEASKGFNMGGGVFAHI